MIRGVVPDPVARQPWRVILPLLALTTFGATVLYSAAGGSLQCSTAMPRSTRMRLSTCTASASAHTNSDVSVILAAW